MGRLMWYQNEIPRPRKLNQNLLGHFHHNREGIEDYLQSPRNNENKRTIFLMVFLTGRIVRKSVNVGLTIPIGIFGELIIYSGKNAGVNNFL